VSRKSDPQDERHEPPLADVHLADVPKLAGGLPALWATTRHLGENDAVSQVSGTIGGALAAAGALAGLGGDVAEADPRLRPIDPKLLVGVSRNAPCPCGSGKKFKHCHGSF